MTTLVCWKCGADLDGVPKPYSRQSECLRCSAPLYVCRMCRHFDPLAPRQCREDRAEPPANKEHANFCDWFEPREQAFSEQDEEATAARDRLDALFGTGERGAEDSPETSSPLDDLFRKD